MKPVIEVEQATKRFGQIAAVKDVSLTVPPGCVFALLGENGAGKTTLVRMMLGLLTANSGRVSVFGLNSDRQGEEIRRRVGYVPERATLYDWMTASEIGWFTAGFYPDGFEQQYLNLLDRFRVPAASKISQMSKGMRAKVTLALAMAHQPELLLLDEPTSGLDTLVRREFLESMADLAAAGRTVVLSSHLIGEVERVADIVAIMREGRVLLVEHLDSLKRTTREITITMDAATATLPSLPGEVVSSKRRTRQWQLLVRGIEDDVQLDQLSLVDSVVAMETRTPSLEEIFVAYMQKDPPASSNTTSAQAGPISVP